MTNIERLKIRLPEATEEELQDLLASAEDVILSRCFVSLSSATSEDKISVLAMYNEKVLNAAVVIFNMRGVEGQTAHSENGVNRSYAEAGGLKPILESITPRGYVV